MGKMLTLIALKDTRGSYSTKTCEHADIVARMRTQIQTRILLILLRCKTTFTVTSIPRKRAKA